MSSRCAGVGIERNRIKRIRLLSNNEFFAYTKKHIHNGTHTRQQTHARATHWARIHAHAPRHDCCLDVDDGRTDGRTRRHSHITHNAHCTHRVVYTRRAHAAAQTRSRSDGGSGGRPKLVHIVAGRSARGVGFHIFICFFFFFSKFSRRCPPQCTVGPPQTVTQWWGGDCGNATSPTRCPRTAGWQLYRSSSRTTVCNRHRRRRDARARYAVIVCSPPRSPTSRHRLRGRDAIPYLRVSDPPAIIQRRPFRFPARNYRQHSRS